MNLIVLKLHGLMLKYNVSRTNAYKYCPKPSKLLPTKKIRLTKSFVRRLINSFGFGFLLYLLVC